jgi:hypothetical protein
MEEVPFNWLIDPLLFLSLIGWLGLNGHYYDRFFVEWHFWFFLLTPSKSIKGG